MPWGSPARMGRWMALLKTALLPSGSTLRKLRMPYRSCRLFCSAPADPCQTFHLAPARHAQTRVLKAFHGELRWRLREPCLRSMLDAIAVPTWMGVPLTIQRRSALTAAAACACCVVAFLTVWPSSSTTRSQLACTSWQPQCKELAHCCGTQRTSEAPVTIAAGACCVPERDCQRLHPMPSRQSMVSRGTAKHVLSRAYTTLCET